MLFLDTSSDSPQNVSAQVVNTSTIYVKWRPPPNATKLHIIRYIVYYREYSSGTDTSQPWSTEYVSGKSFLNSAHVKRSFMLVIVNCYSNCKHVSSHNNESKLFQGPIHRFCSISLHQKNSTPSALRR